MIQNQCTNPRSAPGRPLRSTKAVGVLSAILFSTQLAFGTANYVYHERTGNNPGCGTVAYVPILYPNSLQDYNLRFKVEYQFSTDSLQVYYTTDGSTPSGSKGTAFGTTVGAGATYACIFGSNP